jgi:hypothetical protein
MWTCLQYYAYCGSIFVKFQEVSVNCLHLQPCSPQIDKKEEFVDPDLEKVENRCSKPINEPTIHKVFAV